MKGVLLRVGCDQTEAGGFWNPPVDTSSWDYAYVPIPGGEDKHEHISDCPTYAAFAGSLRRFHVSLPGHLNAERKAHLDPDFSSLSYGEPAGSSRGKNIGTLLPGDFIAYFASYRPIAPGYPDPLAYCLIGIFHISRVSRVGGLSFEERVSCAHGRRRDSEDDLVVWGDPSRSGRFRLAVPIGEFRGNAYRVRQDLLEEWGRITSKDGYIQRSAQPPMFREPERFLGWLERQASSKVLVRKN